MGRAASAISSRGSSESHNGDGGIVLNCPRPVKNTSGRKRKRDEQKKLVRLSAESSSTPAGVVSAAPPVVKNGDAHKDLHPRDDRQTESGVVVAKEDAPPELITDAQPGLQRAGSNDNVDSTAKELSGDDPDLSMRAGLIVNGVSLHPEIVAFNDVVPSQWTYTALSEIRNRAMMSLIGVVSSTGKEPTTAVTGGTNYTSSPLITHNMGFFRLVHLFLLAGPFRPRFVRRGSLHRHCRYKDQLLHEAGEVASEPKARRRCSVASSQGAICFTLLKACRWAKAMPQISWWMDKFTGTCYANTMQWAIYDPAAETLLQPDPKLASYRSHFPPSWDIVPPEIAYCARLVKWWAAVQRTRAERRGTAVQIGGGPIVSVEKKTAFRQHLLIRDADPGREPRGYFNCTVEV